MLTKNERWERYYRTNRDALLQKHPGISAGVLRIMMERDYGKSPHLDRVLAEL